MLEEAPCASSALPTFGFIQMHKIPVFAIVGENTSIEWQISEYVVILFNNQAEPVL